MAIGGKIHSHSYFRFEERTSVDPSLVVSVLRGEMAGAVFRSVIPVDVCERIASNFWSSPSLRQRSDGVPAYYVGTYHYGKEMSVYLDEAHAVREDTKGLFEGTQDVSMQVLDALGECLGKEGVTLRVARHDDRPTSRLVMRSWQNEGNFSLQPHEDKAQLTTRLQAGFEIERAAEYVPVAVNFCLENGGGGDLEYWNWEPDDSARSQLGLQETGYPYPLGLLADKTHLAIPVRKGDIYFFNGANIHAVGPPQEGASVRLTISFLMAFIDPATVIYWS